MDVLDIERGDQQRKSGARAFLFSDFIENSQGIFVNISDFSENVCYFDGIIENQGGEERYLRNFLILCSSPGGQSCGIDGRNGRSGHRTRGSTKKIGCEGIFIFWFY